MPRGFIEVGSRKYGQQWRVGCGLLGDGHEVVRRIGENKVKQEGIGGIW